LKQLHPLDNLPFQKLFHLLQYELVLPPPPHQKFIQLLPWLMKLGIVSTFCKLTFAPHTHIIGHKTQKTKIKHIYTHVITTPKLKGLKKMGFILLLQVV
jgi:hypothetical protein